MLSDVQREMTADERNLLRQQVESAERKRAHRNRNSSWLSLVIGAVGCGWTLAASDAPALVVIPVWAGIAVLLFFLIRLDIRREVDSHVSYFARAMGDGHAREVTFVASEGIVLGGSDMDVYQVGATTMVAVYAEDFVGPPSSECRVIQLRLGDGTVVWETASSKGPRLEPLIRISSKELDGIRYPEHLEVLEGRLADLPKILRRAPKTTSA